MPPAQREMEAGPRRQRALEVLGVFLKIGLLGYGGPAVTVAMMEEEAVTRRRWVSRQDFLDLMGLTNLIPGPNATEMAIHLGLLRAGWPGFWLAGAAYTIPAAAATLAVAWAYLRFGALPALAPFLAGVKPAVLSVVLAALWRLSRNAVKTPRLAAIGLAVLSASLLGASEIPLLFVGGLLGMLWLRSNEIARRLRPPGLGALSLLMPTIGATGRGALQAAEASHPPLWDLFWFFFLRVGAVLYGSGYVLLALLQGGLVRDLQWLSQPVLLDAIAAGQFTPGPLLSTATFVGYVLRGVPGAILATVGVFLPSFIFVAALHRVLPRFRRSAWASAFLDSVNVASLGLMATVTVKLGAATLTDWRALLIALVAAVLALRWKANGAVLVLAGALAGWLLHLAH